MVIKWKHCRRVISGIWRHFFRLNLNFMAHRCRWSFARARIHLQRNKAAILLLAAQHHFFILFHSWLESDEGNFDELFGNDSVAGDPYIELTVIFVIESSGDFLFD